MTKQLIENIVYTSGFLIFYLGGAYLWKNNSKYNIYFVNKK